MTTLSVATLPRSIYIEPTSRCNELCQQCPRTLLSREDDRDLSFEQFRYIVDQFPVLDRVVLHGLGEPLLDVGHRRAGERVGRGGHGQRQN